MEKIEQILNIVKYQRELQVLLHEIKERKIRDLELTKRALGCAKNISRLKPLVNKELLELTEEEKKEVNKMLNKLHLKI